jgi:DNA-binding NtrC family response regulator
MDFYYRLCSDSIQVPQLRQRLKEDPEEIHRLLTRTVERILGSSPQDLVTFISKPTEESLPQEYLWPGNVRELEQCTRRILLKRGYEGDMGGREPDEAEQLAQAIRQGGLTAKELLAGYCRQLYQTLGSYDAVAQKVFF